MRSAVVLAAALGLASAPSVAAFLPSAPCGVISFTQRSSAACATPAVRVQAPLTTRSQARARSSAAFLRMMADGPLSLYSPAKTNLFLRITKKRDDGFHELASVFQALGLGDTLEISRLPDSATADALSCNVAGVPLDGKNLIVQAFDLFRSKTGQTVFFNCDIDKQTPMEGGMGGGSSNCATALWAANKLCGDAASDEDLMVWGGALGSDVSFFLSEGTAYCTGRGEVIQNISPPLSTPPGVFYILKPAEGCSTPAVYKALGLEKGQALEGPDPVALRDKMVKEGISQSVCVNDLEPPAQAVLPKLRDIKQALMDGGFSTVLLSGSGATTFCHSTAAGAHPRKALEAKGLWEDSMVVAGPLPFVSRKRGGWYSK